MEFNNSVPSSTDMQSPSKNWLRSESMICVADGAGIAIKIVVVRRMQVVLLQWLKFKAQL
jgi:hypothetical protein